MYRPAQDFHSAVGVSFETPSERIVGGVGNAWYDYRVRSYRSRVR